MNEIPELFGRSVFNDRVMRERLPHDIYRQLKETINEGTPLSREVANEVAEAMKNWAIENGATHYTHWFQPMTGVTAEKHESFISPAEGDSVIMEFSGKELTRGEPDASSFPSGGLRATFEARGYTAWDPTSNAFIKENTLCIPTVFLSYSGDVLDKKTPLLRSVEAINEQTLRVLRLLGDTEVKRVVPSVGAEQEYFLIDREAYRQRKDLILTGRTLLGRRPPKGQQLDDHYFGTIKPRVKEFMRDCDEEMWKYGVLAKTEHNETAPSQHELAPIYTNVNAATDQNQIMMEVMKKVALRHDLVCLLHEKPFNGINGSGKHNNWSLTTDKGENLFSPGKKPAENTRFLLFLCAVIKAVDEYQDLLRISVATAGNDHRLGANEAPPAIISVFLGDELTEILKSAEDGTLYEGKKNTKMGLGVHALPEIPKDNTDRNRTSPFAFTGNKFEFRSVGSSMSIAEANIVLDTIVSDALCDFADTLEKAADKDKAVHKLIADTIKKHKRIIFNGNGYTKEWEEEAARRGLCNYKTCADCMPHYLDKKNVELFTKFKIFTEREMVSRCEILTENYCKVLQIEAQTMVEMARKDILPASVAFSTLLCKDISLKTSTPETGSCAAEKRISVKLGKLIDDLDLKTEALARLSNETKRKSDHFAASREYRDKVIPAMEALRKTADDIEEIIGSDYYPYPDYCELLFGIDG